MSIKVTHVVRQYLPSIGGMEEVVRNIVQHQLRKGQTATRIITLDRLFRNTDEILPEREKIEGVEVIRLPYSGSSRYPLCPTVLKYLDDADVIHVHGVDFFYDFLAATKWLHKRPLVLSTHGGFFHTSFASRAKRIYFNTITRFSSRAYNRVVATSANDGQMFSNILRPAKLSVIENGVNIEKFSAQSSLELKPTLIYFGRWSANKGLIQSLELFSQLHQQDDRWKFIIAGREYDHTRNELQSIVNRLNLQQQVQLVANPDDETIRQLLTQASYFLCLSQHEGFGIAPIEAMSAGLTPVLSDIPPFRRLIEESGLGFLASEETSNTVAQLLSMHAQGDAAYARRRSAAMEFSCRYAWPQVADRYLAVYAQLANKGKEKSS
jgi:alpha-1,3-mannosyltransferase